MFASKSLFRSWISYLFCSGMKKYLANHDEILGVAGYLCVQSFVDCAQPIVFVITSGSQKKFLIDFSGVPDV